MKAGESYVTFERGIPREFISRNKEKKLKTLITLVFLSAY